MIPKMEADVILETADGGIGPRRIVLDTKFYLEALSGHYGVLKLRSAHLYQLLAYLRNREATMQPGPRHEGILLYPLTDAPLRADVRLEGFSIRARTIDLGQEWRQIHANMLDVVV